MQSESEIRDQLALNLAIIEPNLKFLQKEYLLPNYAGSKGYVDILATDIYGNYVIIEVKRSKSTSRETLQEVIKYTGLVKQNFRAKDSEIRVILLSTHWQELFVPFCEYCYQSTLQITGYQLNLDQSGSVFTVTQVIPEKIVGRRRSLATTYEFALFFSTQKRDQYLIDVAKRSLAIGIKDFVITGLSAPKSSTIIFPYAAVFSFNELTISEYLSLDAVKEEMDMEEDEFEYKAELQSYLEQCVLCALYDSDSYESVEAGSPEKLQSALQVDGWKIDNIERYGIFKSDPRLTDEMLIKELQGYNGTSKHIYSNFADSSQKDRLKEIVETAPIVFECNKTWEGQLETLFSHIQNQGKLFRIIAHVYSPQSIFYGIYYFLKHQDKSYLPMYAIFVDFYDDGELHIYEGSLRWDGKKINEKAYKSFINNDRQSLISKAVDMCAGYHDADILKYYNLDFKTKRTTVTKGKEITEYIEFDSLGNLKRGKGGIKSIIAWVKQNFSFAWEIIQFYEANTCHF